jgi:hypothetical protein
MLSRYCLLVSKNMWPVTSPLSAKAAITWTCGMARQTAVGVQSVAQHHHLAIANHRALGAMEPHGDLVVRDESDQQVDAVDLKEGHPSWPYPRGPTILARDGTPLNRPALRVA